MTNGDGTYGPVSFTPTETGTYHWVASYDGDSPNTNGTTHNTACTDTNEDVVVQQLNPTIATAQNFVPNDSATVTVASGGGDLAGSVRFRLYDNNACSGTALYDVTRNIVTDAVSGGTALNRTVTTANTISYTTSKTFSWLVEYSSTNGGHSGVTSVCDDEHSSISINNNNIP